YFGRLVRDPAVMTDVPVAARGRLAAALLPQLLTGVREQSCDSGATRKVLWRLHDGALVESVLMGDPDRVTACVSSQAGCGMACRHVTVSTVGLVPAVHRLADEGFAVTLALSLHAPDDELRDELVPVNQRWKIAEVLDAAWTYAARTGRRISIEYAMIRDVNDQPWRADLLGRLLAGRLAHVNLIPLNPTPGSRWDASPKPVARESVR